jgi:putative addiction module CopG family antidote
MSGPSAMAGGAPAGFSRQEPGERAAGVHAIRGLNHGLITCRLQVGTLVAYALAMDNVTLPPELERFAAEAVAAGRYRDVAAVVVAGVSLLQRAEAARAEFNASLEEAEAESERLGFLTADEVHAEMSGIIDKARRAKV